MNTPCNLKENPLPDIYISQPQLIPDSQSCQHTEPSLYPLFETMLRSKGMKLQATYTCQDIAKLFGVTARTVQSKVADGTIPSRKLIGGARFLPADIEEYLRNSTKPPPR
jgi:excisionase family DNA binding protein